VQADARVEIELSADVGYERVEGLYVVAPKDAHNGGSGNFAGPRVAQHGSGHPQLALALENGRAFSRVNDFLQVQVQVQVQVEDARSGGTL
jgi:hypothetical protein